MGRSGGASGAAESLVASELKGGWPLAASQPLQRFGLDQEGGWLAGGGEEAAAGLDVPQGVVGPLAEAVKSGELEVGDSASL